MTEFDLAKKLFLPTIETLVESLAQSDLNSSTHKLKESLSLSNADVLVAELTTGLRLAQQIRTRIAETK